MKPNDKAEGADEFPQPKIILPSGENNVKTIIFELITWKAFSIFITVLLCCNCLTIASQTFQSIVSSRASKLFYIYLRCLSISLMVQ